MDLLKFLISSRKSTDLCFLCLESDKNNFDINTVFEIHNKDNIISLSLADMLKNLFCHWDFLFMQACSNCSDLISELYLLMHIRKTKISKMESMINQLVAKTNTIDVPVTNDQLVLNIQVPTFQELKDCSETYTVSEFNLCNNRTDLERNDQVIKSCQYCSETFLQTDALNFHLKIHRKKRVRRRIYHFCNDCTYKTLSKTTLQAHINKNHLNSRPYICQTCYKGFYKRSNLIEHVKTHSIQRNQVCEQCGSSFIHKKSLIEHLRLHSDIRPYKCHICQKSFVTSGRRSDHIKRSHMEKTECCLICNKKYSLKKELRRHMNNVH